MNNLVVSKKSSAVVWATGCLLVVCALLAPAVTLAANPAYGWAKRAGASGEDRGTSVAVDASGNVYTTGIFTGTVNFAADFGGNDTKISAGISDIFVTLVNADGTYGWTKRLGGAGEDRGLNVSADSSGNVYVYGNFYGMVDFAADFGGNDVKNSAGSGDVFVTRINANGTYGWTKRIGGTGDDSVWVGDVSVDSSGNVYVTGNFWSTVNFAADWSGSDSKTSAGSVNVFVTRINADGSYGWTKRMGGASGGSGYGVALDLTGNVYVTGNFSGTANFAADWSGNDAKTAIGQGDIFVTRINADGSYGWTRWMGGLYGDKGSSIAVDASGNVYVTGEFGYQSGGSVNFAADWSGSDVKTSAGSFDAFVTRINANGSYGWTKRMGGSQYDSGTSISLDTIGNVYVTGYFRGTTNFAADWSGNDSKTWAGDEGDIFVTRINADGSYGWTKRLGGTGFDVGTGVAVYSNGNVYMTGWFGGSANFAADFGGSDVKNSAGSGDILIAKISSPDADFDGVMDAGDNCPVVVNPDQDDFEWSSQPGTLILFDDSLSGRSWGVPPELTGATVHDGNTAMRFTANQYIQEISPNLGQSGPQRYLRFWIYLTSSSADLALQMNCGDGEGWDHKWGFSGDGIWSGETWAFDGFDYNVPVGQWVPITLDIQGTLSCDSGSAIYGLGWSVKTGDVAFVDSAAFYPTAPLGDACDDSDGDGLLDSEEIITHLTDPLLADTDGDGMDDGWEVANACMDPKIDIMPALAGSYDTPGNTFRVYVSGSYAYVADGHVGLQVIDVSNPASPTLAGAYNTPGSSVGVSVSGSYAYVADYDAGLQIIDVSIPASPTLAGAYNTSGYARGIYVSGSYAYIAGDGAGLQIIDISNPASPTLAGAYDTPGYAVGVFVSGGYAYVADYDAGLQIIDISNPASPTLAGAYDTPGYAVGAFVSGGHAYIADGYAGLQIINISNPASPTLAGAYITSGFAQPVYVSGSDAYVPDDTGLQVIDVSNPTSPTLAGAYNTPSNPTGVYVSGSLVYVADWNAGLQILRVNDQDADGLQNIAEYALGTNPCAADTDGDSLSDYDEVNTFLTDPNNSDTDGDSLDDGFEAQVSLCNPLIGDTDGDGLNDGGEVLLYGTDPNEVDMDGDGLTDYQEIITYHTDPWLIDSDGDGLSDWSEAVITHTNPTMPDTNANDVPDNYETGFTLTDRDDDGMPTAWEVLHPCGLSPDSADADLDADTDGLTNLQEYQTGTDPCNNNTDSDGLTDGDEVNTSLTDPLLSDTDGDGLIDGDEINDTGTDPLLSDSDGDGYSDGAEVNDDSDPNDPASIPGPRGPEQLINYQGRLADDAGQPVNGTVPITFGIYAGATASAPMWTESQSVTVTQGIYNVLLGSVSPIDPTIFPASQRSAFFLQVTVNGQTLMPRSRLAVVPMAMFADRLFGGRIEMESRELFVPAGVSTISLHVSFNQSFMQPPQVLASSLSGPVEGVGFVSNVTITGFDLKFKSISHAGSGNGSFTYMAFGH